MRTWLVLAGLSGAAAVAMGAVGAHALAGDAIAAGLVDKAARYQLIHALALFGVALWSERHGGWPVVVAGGLFVLGTGLFCGSLYALAFHLISSTPLAPVGGSSFILGWVAVAIGGFASKSGGGR
jgi:uncharacterized membrane protein YgdD (TMEM256/DUF423 family)